MGTGRSFRRGKEWLALLCCAIAALVFADGKTARADVYCVGADVWTGNGACDHIVSGGLQEALGFSESGDEIWVAQGTYKPGASGDPNAIFQLKNGVGLYGGFDGTEAAREDRDWENNATVLSGDLNGDDGPDFANLLENSYSVVSGGGTDNTAVLDGFTIAGSVYTGGMYNDSGSPTVTNCTFSGNFAIEYGGGMYNNNGSSPIVTNCTFSGNSASHYGGGMYNESSSPTVTNCTFSGNSASHYGGGMYNESSSPTVTNCTFSGNSAGDIGGGMFNDQSSPTVTNCTFSDNITVNYGGGGMSNDQSSPIVTNCTFSGNSAQEYGGGMSNDRSSPTVTNCTFSDNNAKTGGGGMFNDQSNPTVTNCAFSGNSAAWGGGMFNRAGTITVTNCTFSGNSAQEYGGGMFNGTGTITVTNCTFSGNSAQSSGGGIYQISEGTSTVANSILWGNLPDQFEGAPTVTYSIVQGGYTGAGNKSEDPLFARNPWPGDDGTWGAGGDDDYGDLRLQSGSPAIDAGDPAGDCPSPDLDGIERPVDGDGNGSAVCDMGAYEAAVAAPAVASVGSSKDDGVYAAGETIVVAVTFSEPVLVSGGTPLLTLETGDSDATVAYSRGSGTDTLEFDYTVAAGHDSDDLDCASADALDANGATIKNGEGQDASLALPEPYAENSLGWNKDIEIDTEAPTVALSSDAPDPTNQSPFAVVATFSEIVDGFEQGAIVVTNGSAGAPSERAPGRIPAVGSTFDFQVTPDGDGEVTVTLSADAATDEAGNGSAAPVSPLSRVYDGTAPTPTIDQADGQSDPTSDAPIHFAVTFDEAVTGFDENDVTVGGTALPTAVVVTEATKSPVQLSVPVAGAAAYDVAVSGMTRGGTVTIGVDANAAEDAAGNASRAAIETDSRVTLQPTVRFVSGTQTAGEGDGEVAVAAELSLPTDLPVTVPLTTAGTATEDSDYSVSGDSLVFEPDSTRAEATILIEDDEIYEPGGETAILAMGAAANADSGDAGEHVLTIDDNDSQPTVSIGDASVKEGDAGETTVAFAATLSNPSAQTVTAAYATSDDTAEAGLDYAETSGTLTFEPGSTEETVEAKILGDLLDEDDETFSIDLDSLQNAAPGDVHGAGSIEDDDDPPTASFDVAEQSAAEDGGTATATVRLSAPSGRTVAVPYAKGGTATEGDDFTLEAADGIRSVDDDALTFEPGTTTRILKATVLEDDLVEPTETILLTLGEPTNATKGAPGEHKILIRDDDSTGWLIHEVLADPQDDANGDGIADASQDEFVEIANLTDEDADISGWSLSDADGRRHEFSDGTSVCRGCALVVFGGGTPAGDFGRAVVRTASEGELNLDDDGDSVIFANEEGTVQAAFSYGAEGGEGVSLSLASDAVQGDPHRPHPDLPDSGGSPHSPGVKPDGTAFNLAPAVDSVDARDVGNDDAGDDAYEFEVAYADDYGMDLATFDASDVSVSGGAEVTAARQTGGTDAAPTVAYRVRPPGGAWDEADNGEYAISLNPDEVADRGGRFVPENPSLATFAVLIDQTDPVANAGEDRTANAPFVQTASATDALSDMTFAWTRRTGPGAVDFGTPDALSTTVAAHADGIYTLRFTATDAAGNSSFDEIILTWDATAPTADAGGDKVANAPFVQTATASDNLTDMTYAWTRQAGPGAIAFGSPGALSTTVQASVDGSYVARFEAADAAGNSSFDDVSFVWDTDGPTVLIGAPSPGETGAGPVTYPVSYAGADQVNLTDDDVTVHKTGTADGVATVADGSTASPSIVVANVSGDGTLSVSIAAGTASDEAGNQAPAAGPGAPFAVANSMGYALSATAATVQEGDAGVRTVSFLIERSGATEFAGQVDIDFGGTAAPGEDYENVRAGGPGIAYNAPTVSFAPGATLATIFIDILGDETVEPDETLVATLSDGTASAGGLAALTGSPATATIADDDASDGDGDGDGVEDDREDRATPFPDGRPGDGNGDGVPDRNQPDVCSLPDAADETMITVENGQGKTLIDVTASSPDSAPADANGFAPNFPYGLIGFAVQDVAPGQIVAMRICVDRDDSIESYWKLNAETGLWTDIAESVEHVGGKTVVAFSIREGGPYDSDDDPNRITDPGGPGYRATAVPTADNWGLLALVLGLTAAAATVGRRKA